MTRDFSMYFFLSVVANSNKFHFPNSTLEYFLSFYLPLSKFYYCFHAFSSNSILNSINIIIIL